MNFLLFAGHNYYPSGGWDDFRGAFASKKDALAEVERNKWDWWHVVDVSKLKVVAE